MATEKVDPETEEPEDEIEIEEEVLPDSKEHMIPKSRLDQEIKKRKDAEKKASDSERTRQESERKRLESEKNFQLLYEQSKSRVVELEGQVESVDEIETALDETLQAQLAELTADARELVPDELTTAQKLRWLARNRARLMKPKAPEGIGAGKRSSVKTAQKAVALTDAEKEIARRFGMSEEEYAKQKGVSASDSPEE